MEEERNDHRDGAAPPRSFRAGSVCVYVSGACPFQSKTIEHFSPLLIVLCYDDIGGTGGEICLFFLCAPLKCPGRGDQSGQKRGRGIAHTRREGAHNMGEGRSSRWQYIRKLAWKRDRDAKAVCHICGLPIDYFLAPSSTPEAYEPDHVIPVSKRPDLELDLNNIAASHRRCNRSRGDGTNGECTVGMHSRIW